jgi:GT2 family glycosyltransferase
MGAFPELSVASVGEGPGVPGLVSVVIPTYNRADLLCVTLRSVLAQTYRKLEILVIDDGSQDHTREVVQRFGPPVHYHYQPNAGVCAARNHGLARARGEFVALLDSDDLWLPWKIEAQVRVLERFPAMGMVWTDMRAVDEEGRLLHERYLRRFYGAYDRVHIERVLQHVSGLGEAWECAPPELRHAPVYQGNLFSSMLMGNLVHTSTVLLRRSRLRLVGGFDESLRTSGEDYEFHLRTCAQGLVGLLDTPSMEYRVGAADQLSAPKNHIHMARNNLTTVLRWVERGGPRISLPPEELTRRLAHAHGWVGEEELQAGNHGAAREHLWKSLRLRPWQRRNAALLLFSLLPDTLFRRAKQALRAYRGLSPWKVLAPALTLRALSYWKVLVPALFLLRRT